MNNNPLTPFLQRQGILVLDGGLATHLEMYGCDLNDALWSARLLRDDPDLIKQVHLDYLEAGADCLITSSYQATIAGFMAYGYTRQTAVSLLQRSVTLATDAREQFWTKASHREGRIRPLVAASIGPYGAYLADGSEYSGHYDLTIAELIQFHTERWHLLAQSEADLFACETIPAYDEAMALTQLLQQTPTMPAWFSFSCRDGHHISDDTPITKCAELLQAYPQVVAMGVNCTAPQHIPSLIQQLQAHTDKPIVVYPNSGEQYDPTNKVWQGTSIPAHFGSHCREWRKLGAALIGGCCRTTPAHIQQIRDRVPTYE